MRQLKNFKAERDVRGDYEGMNGGELMTELVKKVTAAKNDGSYSDEQIDDFVAFVSPRLDDASRKRLAELVAVIKSS